MRSTSNISNHIPDYDLNFEDCDNKDEELICYNDEDQATENEDGMSTSVKNISSKKRNRLSVINSSSGIFSANQTHINDQSSPYKAMERK